MRLEENHELWADRVVEEGIASLFHGTDHEFPWEYRRNPWKPCQDSLKTDWD